MTASAVRKREQVLDDALDRQPIDDKELDNMAELAGPQVEGTDLEHTNILRWKDDGGQAIDYGNPGGPSAPEVAMGNDPLMILLATDQVRKAAAPMRVERHMATFVWPNRAR